MYAVYFFLFLPGLILNLMELKYKPFLLEFKYPFGVSSNTRKETPTVFLELEAFGNKAYGEACLPAYLGETTAETISFFEKAAPVLKRIKSSFIPEGILVEIDSIAPGYNAAKAAIDIALYDLKGKITGQTVPEMFGFKKSDPVATSFTIGIGNEEIVARKIKEAEDFCILKIKAGTENDRQLISMIRRNTDKPLYVDVNQGWKDKDLALEMVVWMKDQNVILIEQPLPVEMKKETRWLTERSPLPIIADESVKRLKDLEQLDGMFSGINIKLMKCTGLAEAFKMINYCREKGIKILLGCMAESSCATTAMAQFMCFADYVDLDAPLLYKNDPFDGVRYSDGKVTTIDLPGVGVRKKTEFRLF